MIATKQIVREAKLLVAKHRQDVKRGKGGPRQAEAIVTARCAMNNVHVTISDFSGRTLGKLSGGRVNLKRGKATAFTGLKVGEEAGRIARDQKLSRVELWLKGYGRARSGIFKGLRNAGLAVVRVGQQIGLPHNGCRARKRRRL